MATPSTPDRLARTSCFSCRRSKRRCDKTLPACQLCSRRGLRCSYPQRRGQRSPSPSDSSHGTGSITVGSTSADGTTGSQSGQVPRISSSFARTSAISFLAPDLFREACLEVPRLDLDIPGDVAMQLGDSQQIRDTTARFFQLTRSWMPIINRKRHLAAALNPLAPSRRPTALLTLCMKLCGFSALDEAGADKTALYRLAKRFYTDVESTEDSNVQVLQASVCIALFEIGNAIYPAAYLTVGACARYGTAMGLDKINKDRMGGAYYAGSWIEFEETRRVWWAILILERYIRFLQVIYAASF
jgi:hypothetical protein